MTIPSIRDFQARGWFLSQEGLDRITSKHENLNSIEDYINCAKNMDLEHLTSIEPAYDQLQSPLILQVVNIQRKKVAAATKASGGLTIVFTDGQNHYTAAEILGKVDCIKPHTPPGTKYSVVKPIDIKDQVLVLGPGILKEEGGYVKELVSNWKKSKKSSTRKPLAKKKPQPEPPLSPRATTPVLSETSTQKKKKHRKPSKNKEQPDKKDSPPDNEEPRTLKPKRGPVKRTKEHTAVEEATETISSSSNNMSPVSENKIQPTNTMNYDNQTITLPPPPPQEYYHYQTQQQQQQPMYTPYMDYSMMVPVPIYHQVYMPPPPYMQPVYYVTDQPHYYAYPPHYTQFYDEGPSYYHHQHHHYQ